MLERIHRGKTGALFVAAASCGALTAGAAAEADRRARRLRQEPRPRVPDRRRPARRRRRSGADGQGGPRGRAQDDVRFVQRRGRRAAARRRAVRDRGSRARRRSALAPIGCASCRRSSRRGACEPPAPDRPDHVPDERVDELRQQLRALGYLDAGRRSIRPRVGARHQRTRGARDAGRHPHRSAIRGCCSGRPRRSVSACACPAWSRARETHWCLRSISARSSSSDPRCCRPVSACWLRPSFAPVVNARRSGRSARRGWRAGRRRSSASPI